MSLALLYALDRFYGRPSRLLSMKYENVGVPFYMCTRRARACVCTSLMCA